MIYRSIPLHNEFSSSELLINRRLHTTWSILENQLQPFISEYSFVCEKLRRQWGKPTVRKFLIHVIEQIATLADLDPLLPGQQNNMDIGEER